MHIFAFLYLFLSYLSINTKELLYIFVPINIPVSSNIAEEINGYVASSPLVNTFLFATSFNSFLFSIKGKHAL